MALVPLHSNVDIYVKYIIFLQMEGRVDLGPLSSARLFNKNKLSVLPDCVVIQQNSEAVRKCVRFKVGMGGLGGKSTMVRCRGLIIPCNHYYTVHQKKSLPDMMNSLCSFKVSVLSSAQRSNDNGQTDTEFQVHLYINSGGGGGGAWQL